MRHNDRYSRFLHEQSPETTKRDKSPRRGAGERGGDVGVVEEVDAEGAGRLAGLVGVGGVRHHPGAFGPVESLCRINLLDRIVAHRREIELALHGDPGMSGEG